jgi:hypothetical protein
MRRNEKRSERMRRLKLQTRVPLDGMVRHEHRRMANVGKIQVLPAM